MTKIKLSDLIDTIQSQPEEYECYVNLKTGEIIEISDEVRSVVEHDDEDYPDWMEDDIQSLIDIEENEENYLALPTQDDLNEYKMMENFAEEQTDENIQSQLFKALQGRGAFSRFKNEITQFGLMTAWHTYLNECYKEYLIDWCEENELGIEHPTPPSERTREPGHT